MVYVVSTRIFLTPVKEFIIRVTTRENEFELYRKLLREKKKHVQLNIVSFRITLARLTLFRYVLFIVKF